MDYQQANHRVKYYKESEQDYILKYEDESFQIKFSTSQVILSHSDKELATLEIKPDSLNLFTTELVVTSHTGLGSGSVVPVNSHKWLVSIQTEGDSTQWCNYELNKFNTGWEVISLDTNSNSVVGRFLRRERGSKLGSLNFTYHLPADHRLFLSMVVGLIIQTRQNRVSHLSKLSFDFGTTLSSAPNSPPATPKSYLDVCTELSRPTSKRRSIFKDLFRSSS